MYVLMEILHTLYSELTVIVRRKGTYCTVKGAVCHFEPSTIRKVNCSENIECQRKHYTFLSPEAAF